MARRSILFVPEVPDAQTSERTPTIKRLLGERHRVIGLPFPWDRFAYDTRRPKPARFVVYVLAQVRAALSGVRIARKEGADLVFCETPHHALVGLLIARLRGIACVWDSHGNALLFARSTSRGRIYTSLVTMLDRFLARRVDRLVTVSRRDADAYLAMGAALPSVEVIPTCVDLERVDREISGVPRGRPDGPRGDSRKVLVFFGTFSYAPNLRALEFIARHLVPYLEERGVLSEIQIAGRDLPDIPLPSSLRPVGFVENLHAWVRRSDLCLVPIWQGVGILTKALDAMAAGTPMVATPLVQDGIPEIRDGTHAQVATTPDDFCRRVLAALNSPERMEEMARNSRRLVEERYDWGLYEPRLEALIQGVAPPIHEA